MRLFARCSVVAILSSSLLCGAQVTGGAPGFAPNPEVNAEPLQIDRGTARLWQDIRQLRTRASLLVINAHPDDEDGGMFAYEARGKGARVMLFTLTHGEGGQNVMTGDMWDAMGLLRTQELLAADRYYGVHQYWGDVADFGFSKTKEETLEKWGHERLLRETVRLVRITRPLVIASTFVGGATDGHGNHQVAGALAQEVYRAAADPKMFPEQIAEGLQPWQPAKVYGRMPFFEPTPQGIMDYATGKYVPVRFYNYVEQKWTEGPLSRDLQIPTGEYDPLLGESYAQIGRTGLGMQRSQNGGVSPLPPGAAFSNYHRFAPHAGDGTTEHSFFDGVDTSLAGIATLAQGENEFLKRGLAEISSDVEQAAAKCPIESPEAIAPILVQGLHRTRSLIDEVQKSSLSPIAKANVLHELHLKEQQFNKSVADALGVSLLAYVAHPGESPRQGGFPESFTIAVPGQQFDVRVAVTQQSTSEVSVSGLAVRPSDAAQWTIEPQGVPSQALPQNKEVAQNFRVKVPENAAVSRPYYSRPNIEQPYYDLLNERYRFRSAAPYPLFATADLSYQGELIRMEEVVQAGHRINGMGLVLDPLQVAPAISVAMSPSKGIIPLSGERPQLSVLLHNEVKGPASGTVHLDLPAGWRSDPAQSQFSFTAAGEDLRITFTVTPSKLEQRDYTIRAVAEYNGHTYTEGYRQVGYEGVRRSLCFAPATYITRGVDVKVAPNLRVGYVMGTGDEVPNSLEDLGIHAKLLSPQELASSDLSAYDCIIFGVRAYAARPELPALNRRILDYVHNGGVVVVQYNTAEYDHNYGPYPYRLPATAEKVVDETAPVALTNPGHQLLNWPNKITPADFNGWVEERGHGFMKEWDPTYKALTETHDPDQDPQNGGLLVGDYGRGTYIYVAFALHRQLPEGVPGAFRLLANLVSYAKQPK